MGEKLRSLRTEKKLTQKQVADRIGLAISAVSSYESGSRYPSYEALIKLARIFHVSTDYLLGITDKRNVDVTGLDDESVELVSVGSALCAYLKFSYASIWTELELVRLEGESYLTQVRFK